MNKKIIEVIETDKMKYELKDITAYPHKFYVWIEVKPEKKDYKYQLNDRNNLAFVYMVNEKKFIDVYGGGIEFKHDDKLINEITSYMKKNLIIDLEGTFNFLNDEKLNMDDFEFI